MLNRKLVDDKVNEVKAEEYIRKMIFIMRRTDGDFGMECAEWANKILNNARNNLDILSTYNTCVKFANEYGLPNNINDLEKYWTKNLKS